MAAETGKPLSVFCISDLHLEFARKEPLPEFPDADVLVLAGDIGHAGSEVLGEFLVKMKQQYRNVVMVPGNHEYYNCKFDRAAALATLRAQCKEAGVTLLQRESAKIDGVWFHGATLWSLVSHTAAAALNDIGQVYTNRFDYVGEFIDDFRWLREVLHNKNHDEPHVVVTHHLPTRKLIHTKYAGLTDANTAFATEILDELRLRGVRLWACGHSHEASSIKYGDTVIALNPVGYPSEWQTRCTKLNLKPFQI